MPSFVALLRGINVGGRNIIPMQLLRDTFTGAGYSDVRTYLQSGNVLFEADAASSVELESALDALMEGSLGASIPTVVRSRDELAATIAAAPADHGAPELRSDVIFLKRPLSVAAALEEMPDPKEGVDRVAPGPEVLYFSRVDARAAESRLSRLVSLAVYKQMTIRNWRTTTSLLRLLDGEG